MEIASVVCKITSIKSENPQPDAVWAEALFVVGLSVEREREKNVTDDGKLPSRPETWDGGSSS